MTKPYRWIAIIILVLGLSNVACSRGGDDGEEPTEEVATAIPTARETTAAAPVPTATIAPAPTASPVPTDTPEPEPTETPESEPDIAASALSLDDLSSYRAVIDMNFDGTDEAGQVVTGTLQMEATYVKEPPANSFVIRMSGFDEFGEVQEMALATIGDTAYTSIGAFGCFSGPSSEMDTGSEFQDLLNPQADFLNDLDKAEYIGEETHNGYEADCYVFDEEDLDESDMSDMETLDGKLCISKELGHVTYMRFEGTGPGAGDFLGTGAAKDGTLVMEYNILDINEPLEVTIPAGCEGTGAESKWPILDDATEVSQFAGITSYHTEQEFDTILEFYDTEMAALGFEQGDEPMIFGTTALLNYSDGEQTVSITVSEDSSNGGFQVLITPDS